MFPITREMLKANYKPDSVSSISATNSEPFVFKIVELPQFGKLQYRYDSHFADFEKWSPTKPLTSNNPLSSFTQNDVDQGTKCRPEESNL